MVEFRRPAGRTYQWLPDAGEDARCDGDSGGGGLQCGAQSDAAGGAQKHDV